MRGAFRGDPDRAGIYGDFHAEIAEGRSRGGFVGAEFGRSSKRLGSGFSIRCFSAFLVFVRELSPAA